MNKNIKITIELPKVLLKDAQQVTGVGIKETVCMGLKLIASAKAYNELRALKGKVKFSHSYKELKIDRESFSK